MSEKPHKYIGIRGIKILGRSRSQGDQFSDDNYREDLGPMDPEINRDHFRVDLGPADPKDNRDQFSGKSGS